MYKTFQGTISQYRTLHQWVERQLGTPMICSNCDSADKTRYHWANISGEYRKDISDWIRLCVSCHRYMDSKKGLKEECKNGHLFTEENTYVNKLGYRRCNLCSNIARFKYNLSKGVIR